MLENRQPKGEAVEREKKAAQEESGRKNAKLARHDNVSRAEGRVPTSRGVVYHKDGIGYTRRKNNGRGR